MSEEEVLELLRSRQALLEGHFELSSGRHSDRYFQCARVLMDPRDAERLAQALADRLPAVDVVVGPALGAVVWAHEMARALGVRGLFTERRQGEMQLSRGFALEPGERVLLVEDVVTTGKSAREALRVVQEEGGNTVAVAAIVNRSGGNPFRDEELDLDLHTLAGVEAESWEPARCPLCRPAANAGPPVKPGSRVTTSAKGRPV